MTRFSDDHAKLLSRELPMARRNSDRLADVLSTQVEALGLTIALAAHGDPAKASELLEGVTARLFEAVGEKAPIAHFLAKAMP